jgi:pSer/pThr/pTyr-binding forkhead associated (FHA) protein
MLMLATKPATLQSGQAPKSGRCVDVISSRETYRLRFQWRSGAESVIPIDRLSISVGRHPLNDVVLNEPSIAAFHAEFQAVNSGNELRVVDVSADHRLWMGGDSIRTRLLYDGDSVQFCENLRVRVECCSLSSLRVPSCVELLRVSDAAN